MTTDPTALQERIRRARSLPADWARRRDGETTMEQTERWQKRQDEQTAALIAAEVQAAKAEAWREYAAALEAVPDYARTEYDRGRVDQRHATVEELHVRATEYETGDQA